MSKVTIPKVAAVKELWKRGEVEWKLKTNQTKVLNLIYELIESRAHRKFIIHCSRRFGKSYILCLLSLMVCIQIPEAQVRYASSTQKSVRNMIMPIIRAILRDCPDDLKPSWSSHNGCYRFGNGSELHIAGCNNGHEDDLRGTEAHLAIVDEASFIDRLQYVTESVLMPQLITTDGILLMSSSSPLSPAHEFASYIQEGKSQGNYASFNIYDADYPLNIIEEFCKEAGGKDSTTWKREYLNELIVDEEFQILPEWKSEFGRAVERDEYFTYYKKYVAMDTGFRDKTALLYAYYDFKKAALIIEDEFTINGKDVTSENIANQTQLYESNLEYQKPYRIADNNDLIFLNDLQHAHKVSFIPTNKDSLLAMVNEVREWIGSGRIVVNPKCKQLLGCIEFGVWDKNRKAFDRSKAYGHYDALAALVYLVRNIDQHTNPIPITHNKDVFNTVFPDEIQESNTHKSLKKLLGVSKS